MGYRPPILHIPLGPYQDEKIIKYLEGGRPFSELFRCPQSRKNSKSTEKGPKNREKLENNYRLKGLDRPPASPLHR